MFAKKNAVASTAKIDTLIGEECSLQGDLSSQNSTKIDGAVAGNVYSESLVIVGEKGRIRGNVRARQLLVYGRIEGDVNVEVLELKNNSILNGKIETHTLQVEPGAVYQGSVVMHSQNGALPDHTPTMVLPKPE